MRGIVTTLLNQAVASRTTMGNVWLSQSKNLSTAIRVQSKDFNPVPCFDAPDGYTQKLWQTAYLKIKNLHREDSSIVRGRRLALTGNYNEMGDYVPQVPEIKAVYAELLANGASKIDESSRGLLKVTTDK